MNATVIAPAVFPNAETSLAWLEPSIANQLEASRYLYCAVIGVCGTLKQVILDRLLIKLPLGMDMGASGVFATGSPDLPQR